MLELTGFLGLTRISFFLLTQIPQIPLYCFVGGKSHRCFCVWAGSRGFHFAFGLTRISLFGLTRISQIPRYCFVGVGSWGLHGARSHGLIFWTLRTNQTYRTNRTDWTFLKIIREICGICVRPRWTPCGRVTKLQKIVLFGGRFERFEKKVWKKLLH